MAYCCFYCVFKYSHSLTSIARSFGKKCCVSKDSLVRVWSTHRLFLFCVKRTPVFTADTVVQSVLPFLLPWMEERYMLTEVRLAGGCSCLHLCGTIIMQSKQCWCRRFWTLQSSHPLQAVLSPVQGTAQVPKGGGWRVLRKASCIVEQFSLENLVPPRSQPCQCFF